MIHIALYSPEIPPNTGNIGRLCVVTGTTLHLIEPLGFSLDEKHLRRAGMDYWEHVQLRVHPDFSAFLEFVAHVNGTLCAFTKFATQWHTEMPASVEPLFLLFGRETTGLGADIRAQCGEHLYRLPMLQQEHCRSLNLSNAVSVALYEVLRQRGFPNLT
ncbi:tRNA (cytidine(34)-2'-O)-methyltransferase [Chrysiogenes arsenatis]|uniref:tRNA (cytidine(34)-2'-O)-methyltransferase n=1 Tax=Chrysiogenes arsenatis TaxID=309797 RepID=UPI0004014B8C|nr:tRNA (cytidine(34)-2'-O)-methyltransferase [Chrysiogenes arsenatis]